MGNCLVTKLKGVVNNDNLHYFNKIKFIVNNTDSFVDIFQINSNCTAEVGAGLTLHAGAAPIAVGPQTIQITSGRYQIMGTGQCFLTDYESITDFTIYYRKGLQTKGLQDALAYNMPLTKLTYGAFTAPNEFFDISKKQQDKTILSSLNIQGENMSTIGSLKEFSKIFDAEEVIISGTGTFGSLIDFAYFPSINAITLYNSAGFSGTVENLVQAIVNEGRSTGTITLSKHGVSITFGGNALDNDVTYTVTWNGIDNINVTETSNP